MAKVSKGALAVGGPVQDLPFEEALKNLESIVAAMETAELPLETLLARFEEGSRLVKICQTKLAEAEVKVQQLESNANGELVLAPAVAPDPGAGT